MFQDGSNKTILSSSLSQEDAPTTCTLHSVSRSGWQQGLKSATTRHARISPMMSSTKRFRTGVPELPYARSFPQLRTDVDTQGQKHCTRQDQNPPQRFDTAVTSHHNGVQQSNQERLVPFASLSAISGTFNSLFKVLFTFPSWYLFAIGLEQIFSLR